MRYKLYKTAWAFEALMTNNAPNNLNFQIAIYQYGNLGKFLLSFQTLKMIFNSWFVVKALSKKQ